MLRTRLRSRSGIGSGGAPAFAPTDISGLQLWLDAADTATITQSGGSVSQWNDKSGNANHATQGTGAYQPVTNSKTINSRNVIDFDGTDDRLNFNSTWINGSQYTVFTVFSASACVGNSSIRCLSMLFPIWLLGSFRLH